MLCLVFYEMCFRLTLPHSQRHTLLPRLQPSGAVEGAGGWQLSAARFPLARQGGWQGQGRVQGLVGGYLLRRCLQ